MTSLPVRGLMTLAFAAWLAAGALTGAVAQPRTATPAPVEGFYVGAFAGAIRVDSKVSFQGNGTQASARLEDYGAILGLRGGWGMRLTPGLYVGLELEGIAPMNVETGYAALGQRYSRRIRNEIGAYGRVGWSPDGQSLLFLRGGVAAPLTAENPALVAVIGAGGEMPITQALAARIDLAYAFPYTRNHVESLRLTAGLVLRF